MAIGNEFLSYRLHDFKGNRLVAFIGISHQLFHGCMHISVVNGLFQADRQSSGVDGDILRSQRMSKSDRLFRFQDRNGTDRFLQGAQIQVPAVGMHENFQLVSSDEPLQFFDRHAVIVHLLMENFQSHALFLRCPEYFFYRMIPHQGCG